MRRALLWTCLVVGMAAAARADEAQAPAADQTPAFPAQIEQVTVDVVVADKQGLPITGLRREDFTLQEDGVPQKIASFEPIDLSAGAAATTKAPPRRVSSNTDSVRRNARTFVIVFDGLHLTPRGAVEARKAIKEFLGKSVHDDDYVMLLGTQSATWLSRLYGRGRNDILAALDRQRGTAPSEVSWDYMSEYEALRIDAFRDVRVGERVARRWRASGYMLDASIEETRMDAHRNGSNPGTSLAPGTIDSLVTDRAREVREDRRVRQDATLALLRRVLGSLLEVKGRKSVLLVSEGFVVDLDSKENKPVREAARRANAAIYFVDARGLMGLPSFSSAAWSKALNGNDTLAYIAEAEFLSEGAQAVAADSGGFTVRNGNDLAGALDRIARESQYYYLLGYYPTRTTADGKFHQIRVSVNRRDVVVRARRGYFATAGDGSLPPALGAGDTFQAAVDSPYDLDAVPLRLTANTFNEVSPGKVRTAVVGDVEVGDFQWRREEDRYLDTVEFLMLVVDRETDEVVERYDQTIELNLREETRAQLQASAMPIVREFELAPGRYLARLVVREGNVARLGSVTHELIVPAPRGLRLSTPVVTDEASVAAGQATPKLVMKAQRTFVAGTYLGCQYEVYGAKASDSDGKPHVSGGHAIVRSDGTPVLESPATPIDAPSSAIGRTLLLSLEGFEPGEYRIVLSVKDEVAGQVVEDEVPFVVTAPDAAAGASPQGSSGPVSMR